jgi:hypothetical protein
MNDMNQAQSIEAFHIDFSMLFDQVLKFGMIHIIRTTQFLMNERLFIEALVLCMYINEENAVRLDDSSWSIMCK